MSDRRARKSTGKRTLRSVNGIEVPRAMSAWADSDCESVYLEKEIYKWPPWAQGRVIVVKQSDWNVVWSGYCAGRAARGRKP